MNGGLVKGGFDVVGMASSAGGLSALTVVLGDLGPDFPATVLIVQHLDPRHRSLMADILNRRSEIPVTEAGDGDKLLPGHVFCAPPNHHLLVNPDGTLGERNAARCASIEHKLGIHASPTAVMVYDGALGYLVGEENKGVAYMFIMMNLARFAVGLEGVSIAERAFQRALAYHMVNANVPKDQVVGKKGPVPSIVNTPINVDGSEGAVKVNGDATVLQSGVMASNGSIYVVDKVLTPPSA